MITVNRFYQEIRTGSSLPLIVGGNDGCKYVLKPNGSGDGILASIVDWLALKLGSLVGIPVLDPKVLLLEKGLIADDNDPEIIELVERSIGKNFGTPYLEGAAIYDSSAALPLSESLKNDVFLYDLFLLNIDRTARNPNIVKFKDEIRCLDFSSSITLRGILEGKDYNESLFLPYFKYHPFYSETISTVQFILKLKTLLKSDLVDTIEKIPDEWIFAVSHGLSIPDKRREIASQLVEKLVNDNLVQQKLAELSTIKTETEAERKSRILKNRSEFEKNVKRTG